MEKPKAWEIAAVVIIWALAAASIIAHFFAPCGVLLRFSSLKDMPTRCIQGMNGK